MRPLVALCSILSLALLPGCLDAPPQDRSSGSLEGGTPEYGRPEVLMMRTPTGSCTATLIHPRVALTAKHCVDTNTQAPQTSFSSGQTGQTFEAHGAELVYYGQLLGHVYQDDDLLLVVLDRVLSIAPAARRTQPLTGSDIASKVRMVGFGGTRPDHSGGGAKTSGPATITTVGADTFQTLRNATGEVVCRKGDSGGPVFYQGEVAGVMFAAPGAGILYYADVGGHRCEATRVDRYPNTIARAIARADAITAWEQGPQSGGPNAGGDPWGDGYDGSGGGEGEGEGEQDSSSSSLDDACASYDWQITCVSCDGWDDTGDGCCDWDAEDPETCGQIPDEPEPDCSCADDCSEWDDCCQWC